VVDAMPAKIDRKDGAALVTKHGCAPTMAVGTPSTVSAVARSRRNRGAAACSAASSPR
jgi:hypothetical protein